VASVERAKSVLNTPDLADVVEGGMSQGNIAAAFGVSKGTPNVKEHTSTAVVGLNEAKAFLRD
jgi:hypothetical protein